MAVAFVGDLLINAGMLLITAYYGLLLFRRYGLIRRVRRLRRLWLRLVLAGVVVVLFYGLLDLLYHFYTNSVNNSQLVLDITQNIQFSGFKLLLCLAIVLHSGGYLVGFYILSQLFNASVQPLTRPLGLALLVVLTLLLLPAGLLVSQPNLLLMGLTLFFFLVLRITGLKQIAAIVPYQIYLFIFLMLAASARRGRSGPLRALRPPADSQQTAYCG